MSEVAVAAPVAETPAVAPAVVEAPAAEVAPVVQEPRTSRTSGFVAKMIEARKAASQAKQVAATQTAASKEAEAAKAAADRMAYIRANAVKNPRLIAEEFGISNDALIAANLGTYQPPEPTEDELFDKKMEKYLAPYKEKVAKYDEYLARSEAQAQAQEKTQEKMIMENIKKVASSGEYAWVDHYGQEAHDTVRETLYKHWEDTGLPLPYDEACAMVDEYYKDKAISLTNTKAFQKLIPKVEPVKEVPKESKPKKEEAATTLTEKATKSDPILSRSPAEFYANSNAEWQEMKKKLKHIQK